MPITKEINREAVRLLAIEHGVREAARMVGLNEDRVRQWSSRYNWMQANTPHHNQAVTNVTTLPGDAHLATLQAHERETKLGLARYAKRQAEHLAEAGKLSDHGAFRNLASGSATLHGWNAEAKPTMFSLNVLNINTLSVDESPSLDA